MFRKTWLLSLIALLFLLPITQLQISAQENQQNQKFSETQLDQEEKETSLDSDDAEVKNESAKSEKTTRENVQKEANHNEEITSVEKDSELSDKHDEDVDEQFVEDPDVEANDLKSDNENLKSDNENTLHKQDTSQESETVETQKSQTKINTLSSQNNDVLKKPMRDPRVIDLKHKLNRLGFTNFDNPTNYFGVKTETGVKEFQKYYGLPVTGEADSETLDKIEDVLKSPFQRGKRNAESITIKQQLVILGYANFKNPNDLYGVQTEVAVKAFQRDNGLPVSGIAEATTRALLAEQANSPLRRGMYREDVVQLKQNLNKLGFTNFKNPNTFFGVQTERGLKAFQDYYGLPSTGIADQKTLDKINEVLDSPFQRGKRHKDSIKIKQQLTLLGYANFKNPTTLYGVQTEAAVKAFQRDNGLPVSGIAEATTRAMIEEHATAPLRRGMYREDAVQLKQNLNKLGFTNFKNPNTFFGVQTERGLKDLQNYYGLTPTGVADQETLKQINEVLNSPFQRGKRHGESITIKQHLVILGYAKFKNPNDLYGVQTEAAVKAFQKDYRLPVSGIADATTREKLSELANGPLRRGMYRDDAIQLKRDLTLLGFATFKNPNNFFGAQTEKSVKRFQSFFGLKENGIANDQTLKKIEEVKKENIKYEFFDITLEQALDIQMAIPNPPPQTDKYRNKPAFVSARYVKELSSGKGEITGIVNVRAEANASSHIYGQLAKGTKITIIEKVNNNWYRISYDTWRNATRSDTKAYLDPNKNSLFQHLDLSTPAGATVKELNEYLKGRGILEGQGRAFYDAARMHNINELYLISHAIHETGNGTSKLAKGITVNGKTVYNMFGIGAHDSCPEKCGSQKAYEEGWDTPYKAIVGGAKFIGERYVHNEYKQNTLYKMRWNPLAMEQTGQFGRQYATDIGWAVKQTERLMEMYNLIVSNPVLKYNIIQYRI